MHGKNQLLIIALLFIITPLAGIGTDLFVPSLPIIAQQFDVNETWVKLTIASYMLGYAIAQPFFGSLSDSYGRKLPLLAGTLGYIIASFSITLVANIHAILLLRFLQGVLVAAPGTIVKAIRTDVFVDKHMAKLSSALTMTGALSTIVAPLIGGYLEVFFGWQSSFYFFAIYGIIILLLSALILPETNVHKQPFGLQKVFATYQTIFTHKLFLGSVLSIAIVSSFAVCFNVIAPFLVEKVMGHSPIIYGHLALFLGLGFFLGSAVNGILLHHYPASRILAWAIYYSVVVTSTMLICVLIYGLQLVTLILFTFLLLFGAGSIFPNSAANCLSLFPKSAGSASASMGSFYVAGNALVAIIASMLESSSLMPLSLLYLVLTILCLLVYLGMLHHKK